MRRSHAATTRQPGWERKRGRGKVASPRAEEVDSATATFKGSTEESGKGPENAREKQGKEGAGEEQSGEEEKRQRNGGDQEGMRKTHR